MAATTTISLNGELNPHPITDEPLFGTAFGDRTLDEFLDIVKERIGRNAEGHNQYFLTVILTGE